MNFSWGYKITLLYSTFAAFIFVMVYKSSQLNTELVREDYYQAEITYQDRLEQMQNSRDLAEPVKIRYKAADDKLVADMPALGTDISGKVLVYRPSDSKMDKTIELALADGADWEMSTMGMASGLWRVEMEWTANGKDYYENEVVILK